MKAKLDSVKKMREEELNDEAARVGAETKKEIEEKLGVTDEEEKEEVEFNNSFYDTKLGTLTLRSKGQFLVIEDLKHTMGECVRLSTIEHVQVKHSYIVFILKGGRKLRYDYNKDYKVASVGQYAVAIAELISED